MYSPDSKQTGALCKMWMKTELQWNLINQYSIHTTTYKTSNAESGKLYYFVKNSHLESDDSHTSNKKSWDSDRFTTV